MPAQRVDLLTTFWRRIDMSGGPDACWPWRGPFHRFGYGTFHNGASRVGESPRRIEHAHRFAMALAGHDTRGHLVLHRCDNPPCCNPAHLYLGTQADNMHDRLRGGKYARGSRHHAAKLTEEDVRRIRASHLNRRTLAAIFGVRPWYINQLRRTGWEHV